MIFWESQEKHFGVIELCDLNFIPATESLGKTMRQLRGSKFHNNRPSTALNKTQQTQLDDQNRFVRNPIRFVIKSNIKICHDFATDP